MNLFKERVRAFTLGIIIVASAMSFSRGYQGLSGIGYLWANSGSAITTPVNGPVVPGTGAAASFLSSYFATNTSSTTAYYLEMFPTAASNVTLGVTAPSLITCVPFGPSGATEHWVMPNSVVGGWSWAFVTQPNGSSAAPSNTCYLTVSYR